MMHGMCERQAREGYGTDTMYSRESGTRGYTPYRIVKIADAPSCQGSS